jgi:hypothetical protein
MTIYKGIFGSLYAVNQRGVVCVKPDGGEWRPSNYSVEGFQDAIDKGYVTEVVDDQGVN